MYLKDNNNTYYVFKKLPIFLDFVNKIGYLASIS